jgi:hypothetical protein
MGRFKPHRAGLADAQRAAFARRTRERFPSMPWGEEGRIARFACGRETGRVGALVGADGYLDHAVELAVIAHIRHRHTRYEALLDLGLDRDEAREAVRGDVLRTLARWGGAIARGGAAGS